MWSGKSLEKDAADVVDGWLEGRSTHFVIEDNIGLAGDLDWRKVMVNLNTMRVVADSTLADAMEIDDMISACKKLDEK